MCKNGQCLCPNCCVASDRVRGYRPWGCP